MQARAWRGSMAWRGRWCWRRSATGADLERASEDYGGGDVRGNIMLREKLQKGLWEMFCRTLMVVGMGGGKAKVLSRVLTPRSRAT
jgi:hypothetical protein